MTRVTRVAVVTAAVSLAGLLLLVGGVGAFAMYAELRGTWSWYRQMEVVVATAAQPAVALAAVATLAALVGTVTAE